MTMCFKIDLYENYKKASFVRAQKSMFPYGKKLSK